jgi:membrane fusion protein
MTRTRALFRQEAVDFHQHRQQWGDVASLQPVSTKIATWFLAVLTAGLIAFLFIAQYARKETAVGYLTPTKGTAKVFVPRRGAIREVHVDEGDTVTEGQPLLTIDTDQIASDGSDVNASVLDTLAAQKALLAKNIEAEEQRAGSERERLSLTVRGLESEIAQLQSQIVLQEDRLKLLTTELQAAEQLSAKGYMTAVDFRRRQLASMEQQQVLSGLNQQVAAKQNQLTEARFALTQLPTVMAQKVQSIRNDLSATEQRIAEIKGRGAYVIRSPISGRVSTLQATPGQSADPQASSSRSFPPRRCFVRSCLCPHARSASSKQGRRCAFFTTRSRISISALTAVRS